MIAAMNKMFKLPVFNQGMPLRASILELDYVLDAIWEWEEKNHGKHEQGYSGRALYEAVIELQEWLISEDK